MIIPAILAQDKDELEQKLKSVSGLVQWAQVDIMDGKFVDNISVSLDDLLGIDHQLNLSIHLMVENPADYFAKCQEVGAKRVIFHAKASDDHQGLLKQLDQLGLQKGIALSLDVPVEDILPVKDLVDVFLVMGVVPGKGGQEFIEASLEKIKELSVATNQEVIVDGGVGLKNIFALKNAGATGFVVGSEIFEADNIPAAIKKLESIIKS